ncbi:MAG: hypothetical protein M1831_001877 [Alyxoria varia]|nr:MAG: hypothetical protein M1831_001877 [Alyxoria varia]
MTTQEELRTYAVRLTSFDGPHQVAKRRASSAKKKAPTTVSWPHKTPKPEQLAKAGFYYKPTASSNDSVTCFLCQKSLDGWDAGDNPAIEHLNHVPDCGWAINVCIEQRSQDMDRAEEDPMSEKMVEARRATYQDAWPHESRKGWKCKMQKMIDAGWSYSPLPEADDCVTCFYCGISLDGWEPKDDPWQEHRRRAPECHFFTLVEESAKLKRPTKAKKGKTTRASKASRASRQSNLTVGSEGPSLGPIEDDTLAKEDESLVSTATTTSKKAGSRQRATRSKKVQADDLPSGSMEESLVQDDDSILTVGTTTFKPGRPRKAAKPKAATKRNTRNTRAKKDSVMDEPTNMDVDVQNPVDYEEPPPEPTGEQPARTRRGAKRAPKQQHEDSSLIIMEEPPKPKTTRTKKQKQPEPTPDDASQLPQEKNNEMSSGSKRMVSSSKRGIKRTSDGREKEETSIVLHSTKSATPPKASTETNASKKAMPQEEPAAKTQDRHSDNVEAGDAEASAPKPKRGRGRPSKQKQKSSSLQLPTAPLESDIEQTAPSHQAEIDRVPDQELRANHQPFENQESMPKPISPSPQSSDAENHPPSSRPSKTSKQMNGNNEPTMTPVEIKTPFTSPSKRNKIAEGLKTFVPWDPVDLETAFLPSPPMSYVDKQKQAYEKMNQMTIAEKRMTVEEWILWNAGKAEEGLKNQCEGMISTFEREGMKALRSVEGIESA